jgi:hypothetical protein
MRWNRRSFLLTLLGTPVTPGARLPIAVAQTGSGHPPPTTAQNPADLAVSQTVAILAASEAQAEAGTNTETLILHKPRPKRLLRLIRSSKTSVGATADLRSGNPCLLLAEQRFPLPHLRWRIQSTVGI